ncbi:MAG: nucleotidyltransferase family protein [Defluviitaleaceae bacterium]|nr:nucleotidyltransferase family protein [Defluviitaleaceae bacterium]
MASGLSRRLGTDKLTLEYKNKPLAVCAIEAIKNACADERIIVTNNPRLAKHVAGFFVVPNPDAEEGKASAIRAGVLSAAADARYIFLVADQPFVTAEIIDGMIALSERNPDKIIVCGAQGRRGNPVLFPNAYRDRLLALSGDAGGRALISQKNSMEYAVPAEVLFDVDTAEDYETLDLLTVTVTRSSSA